VCNPKRRGYVGNQGQRLAVIGAPFVSFDRSEVAMFMHVQRMINEIVPDEPDPAAANALQEGLGGQFGEMRTMMQYLFQAFNFRG
jgi:hypothetical protein